MLSYICKILKVHLAFGDMRIAWWLPSPHRNEAPPPLPFSRLRRHVPKKMLGVNKSFLYCNYSIPQYLFFPKYASVSYWLFHFYFTSHQSFLTFLELSLQNLMKTMALGQCIFTHKHAYTYREFTPKPPCRPALRIPTLDGCQNTSNLADPGSFLHFQGSWSPSTAVYSPAQVGYK